MTDTLRTSGWRPVEHLDLQGAPDLTEPLAGLLALTGRSHEDLELFAHSSLADVFAQGLGSQCPLERFFGTRGSLRRHDAVGRCGVSGEVVGLNAHGGR